MVRPTRPGDEPVLPVPDEEYEPRGEEVAAADAADQARDARPAADFEPPALDGEVSEYDALEQARLVALDEDDEGHDPAADERFDPYRG